MAADATLNAARGIRQAAARASRESALDGATIAPGASMIGTDVTIDQQFSTGYDGSLTTVPFVSDVSVEGGTDIVVG